MAFLAKTDFYMGVVSEQYSFLKKLLRNHVSDFSFSISGDEKSVLSFITDRCRCESIIDNGAIVFRFIYPNGYENSILWYSYDPVGNHSDVVHKFRTALVYFWRQSLRPVEKWDRLYIAPYDSRDWE